MGQEWKVKLNCKYLTSALFDFINVIVVNVTTISPNGPCTKSHTSTAILFCDITKPLENDIVDIVHYKSKKCALLNY